MSIKTVQVTVNASNPTPIGTIPNGVCDVVIINGDASGVLVGPSNTNLNASTGVYIPPNGVIRFQGFASSKGCTMYGLVTTGGGTGPVSMLVSSTD